MSTLCLALVLPATMLGLQPLTHSRHVPRTATLSQRQRVLHALNRFTFGPRPGDVTEISRAGLDAWFEEQLHPERIADPSLTARLERYPAVQLSQTDLIARFPSPQRLRRYSQGVLDAPNDPVGRAIYADASLRYEQKLMAGQMERTVFPSTQADSGTQIGLAPPPNAVAGSEKPAEMSPERKRQPPASSPMDTETVDAILALPASMRMQNLLALSPEQMQGLRAALKHGAQARLYAGLSPAAVEQVAAMQDPVRVVDAEVTSTRLLRDVYTERQLQAVMTDFWLNHFNVYLKKDGEEPYLLPAYEREAILPHALGRFEDLLVATAKSPAMLVYLDNWTSIGPNSRAAGRQHRAPDAKPSLQRTTLAAKLPKGINENYARELMELHTLGVNGGYTQQDVIEVAKCFTGWTITRPVDGGIFQFDPNRHEPGPKTVLGHVIPEGGEDEGLAVLHLLATSPSTAHFLSLELAQQFVADTPPPVLVDRMAAAYLGSDGDIATVLRTMFHSREFWNASTYGAKVKTPLEFVVSALRAGNAEVSDPLPLVGELARLGMPLYGMQTPNGYGGQASDWVSSSALLARLNLALVLAEDRLPGTTLNWPALLANTGNTSASPDPQTEEQLERVLLGEAASPRTRAAILQQSSNRVVQQPAEPNVAAHGKAQDGKTEAGTNPLLRTGTRRVVAPGLPATPFNTMAGLLLGSPEFQRR